MPDDLPAGLLDPNRYSLRAIVRGWELYQHRTYPGLDSEGCRSSYWVKMSDTLPTSPQPPDGTHTPCQGEVRSALPQPGEERS